RFGGDFKVEFYDNWKKTVKNWEGTKVHLTMYGEHINKVIKKIPRNRELLVIVGAEKVPGEVYELADFNVAVGNQPHSEVAALAVFLDRYSKGNALERDFEGKIRIIPSKKGKRVVEK
ncbi:MAG: tRNA (cytidine(56)-2'-O)-methyltransferase, partial [Thermoplasmatales archaeon]|nr:tRNA (cytidine(56)-2'-O)-methyltransferase [Thermoplasmatales archaeon]